MRKPMVIDLDIVPVNHMASFLVTATVLVLNINELFDPVTSKILGRWTFT